MADVKALKSYLVSLGFAVNQTQLTQFNTALQQAATMIEKTTINIRGQILKWEAGLIGAFTAVGGAVVATADKVAMADQQYRLYAQTMFMSTEQAKKLKISTDMLGASLAQIAFDPELHGRYEQLSALQDRLAIQLGGKSFEDTMRQIRDVRFEVTKFQVEMLYFTQSLVKNLFQGVGGKDFITVLKEVNEYIVANMPRWVDIVTRYLIPVLKDVWMILKDVWKLIVDVAQTVTNLVGIISSDKTLAGTVNFEKFAAAVGKVAHALAVVLHLVLSLQGTLTGAIIGGRIGGPIGMAIGAAAGGAWDLARSTWGGSGASGTMGAASLDQIVSGVMQVESGGHQTNRFGGTLTSSAGALGLMQLMPGTAKGLGVNPNDAAQNLAGGRTYLSQLFNRYGNWHDALGAYNWGPGHVDAALRKHSAFPSSVEGYINKVSGKAGVSIGTINIMQPNASADQIANAVMDKVQQQQNMQTSSNLNELRTIYG